MSNKNTFRHGDIVRLKNQKNNPNSVAFIGISSMSDEVGIFECSTTNEVYADTLSGYELVEAVILEAEEIRHFQLGA
ncbi:hypothetical protein [Vibrio campbellii]|uniref:hypothetical protein n=1 Tax=Vibrio campbellii TaxID=680 RepID=UPI00210E672C|nr:hypothetical protein [Vibrio campbellii]UTZ44545.1 hypothetical protein HB764_25120 [Vibrio campbellii]